MLRLLVVAADGSGPTALPGIEILRLKELDAAELGRADAVLFVWPPQSDFELDVYRARTLQGSVALLLWAHTEEMGDIGLIGRCELDGFIDARWSEELAAEAVAIAVRQVRSPSLLAGEAVPRGENVSLYDVAVADALTGLRNRRSFDETLAREHARAKRYTSCYALVIADIDKLKAVNQQHGRDAGSAVLRHVARALASHVRECDGVFRFGSDELAILLPYARHEEARELAQRLGEVLSLQPVETGEATVMVSLSFGIACYPEAGSNAADVVQAAVMALGTAQSRGKGQLAVAS